MIVKIAWADQRGLAKKLKKKCSHEKVRATISKTFLRTLLSANYLAGRNIPKIFKIKKMFLCQTVVFKMDSILILTLRENYTHIQLAVYSRQFAVAT